MCEILGVTSKHQYNTTKLLDSFYSHSKFNADGWGLAVFRGRGVSIEKEPVRALDSGYLRQRLSRDIVCSNLFAHIRRATIGPAEYSNCHPFVWDDISGRTWTIIHNGTFFKGDRLLGYSREQEGTTDSERFLLYIIDRVNELITNEGAVYTDDPLIRFSLIDEILTELSDGNKINMLLCDSEYIYVHTNCPETLHKCEADDTIIFATRPMTGVYDGWEQLELNRLHVYRNGRHVWDGTDHGNVFYDEDHDYTSLFSAFAEL